MDFSSSFGQTANSSIDFLKSRAGRSIGTGIGAGMTIKSGTDFIGRESDRLEAKKGRREERRGKLIENTKTIKKDPELSIEEKES